MNSTLRHILAALGGFTCAHGVWHFGEKGSLAVLAAGLCAFVIALLAGPEKYTKP